MNSFNYENLKESEYKTHLSNTFKLFFRRPLFSFIPYIALFFFLSFIFDSTFMVIGVAVLYFFIEILFPIVSIEMSYSNDYSKTPFTTISHLNEFKTNPVYIEMLFKALKLFISFVIMYSLVTILSSPSEVATETNIQEKKEASAFLISSLLFVGIVVYSAFLFGVYRIVFLFGLTTLPTFIKNVPQSNELTELARIASDKNDDYLYKLFLGVSVIQSALLFGLLYFSSFIALIVFSFCSGLGFSLCYILAKEMSGGGSKLEEKQSLFSKLFQGKLNTVNSSS